MTTQVKEFLIFSHEGADVFITITNPGEGEAPLSFGALTEYIQTLKYTDIDFAALKRAFKQERGKPVAFAKRTIGLGYTSRFRIEVTEDTMTCYVILLPPREKEELTHSSIIIDELKKRGIVYGIDEKEINRALENKAFKKKIVAASGLMPLLGEDAKVKLTSPCFMNLVTIITQRQPRWLFQEFVLLNQVQKGDCIAELLPETIGRKGITIYGVSLPVLGGEPLRLKGRNVTVNGNEIISKITGRVTMTDGEIDVEPVLRVESIDNKHIEFNGSIEFMGDVRGLQAVKATGDIVVHGSVDETSLIAGRNILIQGNLGSSEGLVISAGADFAAMQVSRANIKAENILILSSSMKSELLAYRGIFTLDPNSTILGGHSKAGRFVLSKIIGSPRNVPTLISVATPKVMNQCRDEILAPLTARVNAIKKVKERTSSRLMQVGILGERTEERERKAYSRLEEELKQKIEECEKNEQVIYKQIVGIKDPKNRDAIGDISANKYYPQTVLYMGHCERTITETKENIRYRLKESSMYTESFDKKDKSN